MQAVAEQRYETISFDKLTLEQKSDPCGFCKDGFDEKSKIKVHNSLHPLHKACLHIWAKACLNQPLTCITCHVPIDRSSVLTEDDIKEEREYKEKEIIKALHQVEKGLSPIEAYRNLSQFLLGNEREGILPLIRKAQEIFKYNQINAASIEWSYKGAVTVASITATLPLGASFIGAIIHILAITAFSYYLIDLIFNGVNKLPIKKEVLAAVGVPFAISLLTGVPSAHIAAKLILAIPAVSLVKKLFTCGPSLEKIPVMFLSCLAGASFTLYAHILLCEAYGKDGGLFFDSPPSAICRI